MKLYSIIRRILVGSPLERAKKQGLIAEEGVTVMADTSFGSEPYLIHLHKNCRISRHVTFLTHDGVTWAFRNDNEKYKDVIKFGKIEVGAYSFVGANATIMPGVTIGDHCVIGAGAVVTKDVPSGMVAAGVPARIICSTETYAQKCLDQMPKDFDQVEFYKNKKAYLINYYMKEV